MEGYHPSDTQIEPAVGIEKCFEPEVNGPPIRVEDLINRPGKDREDHHDKTESLHHHRFLNPPDTDGALDDDDRDQGMAE